MSGRPQSSTHGSKWRSTQMSQMEIMIARKKAEIEAKLNKNNSSDEGQQPQTSKVNSTPLPSTSTSTSGLKPKKGFLSKNRWGFKGKKEVKSEIQPQQSSDYAVKTEIESPRHESSAAQEFYKNKDNPGMSKQEHSWFNEALKKARDIASQQSQTESSTYTQNCSASPKDTNCETKPLAIKVEIELPTLADELASLVAVNGDQVEVMTREHNPDEEQLNFLHDPNCELYQNYRAKVDYLRRGFCDEGKRVRKRTRWGDQDNEDISKPAPVAPNPVSGRSPELVAYAHKVFGTLDLEEHQWKQCNDQMKMSLVYQDMLELQAKTMAQASRPVKRQYEYDSDEDTEGGTWEHKARKLEMEKTAAEACKLTQNASGRHHIGDFIPPEELNKFLAKYQAVKNGEEIDESDYQNNKIESSNMGFKMLQKMGWSEGSGLGANAQGITNPINQGSQSDDKKGLGTTKPHDLSKDDDEFDAYRKRMMLAYRFRPNPLNNPRRAYY